MGVSHCSYSERKAKLTSGTSGALVLPLGIPAGLLVHILLLDETLARDDGKTKGCECDDVK